MLSLSRPSGQARLASIRRDRRVALVRASPLDAVFGAFNKGKVSLAVAQGGDYDRTAVAAKINSAIQAEGVMVFSWSGCPYCKKAKSLLSQVGAKYTAWELDTMEDGKAIRAELAQMTDRSSMPNIFIAGKGVGGCNDGPGVMTLYNQGQLVPLLQQAGAL